MDASLAGDLKQALRDINNRLEQQEHTDWMKTIADMKEKYPLRYDPDQLSCPYVIETIERVTEGEAVITTDVGQHQMWAAQYFHYTHPRTLMSSGGLGKMVYVMVACIGDNIGQNDKILIKNEVEVF